MTGTQIFLILVALAFMAVLAFILKIVAGFGKAKDDSEKNPYLVERNWKGALVTILGIGLGWYVWGMLLTLLGGTFFGPGSTKTKMVLEEPWEMATPFIAVMAVAWAIPQIVQAQTTLSNSATFWFPVTKWGTFLVAGAVYMVLAIMGLAHLF
ncbi:MAG: hypothetical protein ABH835_05205 [Patescibacteria group bacterium]